MMLELHNVSIGRQVQGLSMTVNDGELASLSGPQGSGKTAVLKAVVGLIPVDTGHISIDGELLTPKSAPYFRRYMAYVPQHLVVPEGYDKVPTDYVELLRRAVSSDKQLLIVDEPPLDVRETAANTICGLLQEAVGRGATVLAVNMPITEKQIRL